MSATCHRLRFGLFSLIPFLAFNHIHAQPPPRPWLQPPGFLIRTNDPDQRGGNRPSNLDWNQPPETTQPAVADDFIADAYRIHRVRWWGSYLAGYEPLFEDAYLLSFFLDHTSRPSTLMGTYIAPITSVTIVPTSFTGADGHPIFQYEVELNQTCLAYQGFPDAEAAGFHATEGRRYWLSVQAAVGRRFSGTTNQAGSLQCVHESTIKSATNNFWGWHTSPTNRASASVSGHAQTRGAIMTFQTASWQPNASLFDEFDQAVQLISGCDDKPPRIASVTGYCAANIVKVVFDEKVDPMHAGDAFNYSIGGSTVSYVMTDRDHRSVWIVIDSTIRFRATNHWS